MKDAHEDLTSFPDTICANPTVADYSDPNDYNENMHDCELKGKSSKYFCYIGCSHFEDTENLDNVLFFNIIFHFRFGIFKVAKSGSYIFENIFKL